MADQEKKFNIVKKVFDRSGPRTEKISPLFTHSKGAQKKAAKAADKANRVKDAQKRFSTALDFGSDAIRVLQFSQGSQGGMELMMMDEEKLSEDSTRAPMIKNKLALEKLLSRNSVGSGVIVGLPAKETQTFNFTFPAMSAEELREAVKWKIKQIRPFDLDEEKVKYAILRWDAEHAAPIHGGQQRVTVVCVAGDNLIEKTELLREFGLKPAAIHASPIALTQAGTFGNIPKKPEEVVLWLDLGAEESVLIVEKAGVVYFVRNLSITGRQLTKYISQACRVDEIKAAELKKQHGLNYWSPQFQNRLVTDEEISKNSEASVCMALLSLLENLVIDIEHSFKFFSYQITQSQIPKFDRVVLTGPGSHLSKLELFLSDRLAVPVNKLNPLFSVKVQDSLKSKRVDFSEDVLSFASAVGLALTLTSETSKLHNFIGTEKKKRGPNPFIQKIKAQPKFATAVVITACIFLAAPEIAIMTYYKNEADKAVQRVKDARAELKRRQSSQLDLADQEKKLLEKKAALQDQLALFQKSRREKRSFAGLLAKISALLPDEVWITKLAYSDKKMVLAGSTSKNEHVVSLLENLKKPEEFGDVLFNYTKRNSKSSVFSFEVLMNVK